MVWTAGDPGSVRRSRRQQHGPHLAQTAAPPAGTVDEPPPVMHGAREGRLNRPHAGEPLRRDRAGTRFRVWIPGRGRHAISSCS